MREGETALLHLRQAMEEKEEIDHSNSGVHTQNCHSVLRFTPNLPPCFSLTQKCHYV